jgi:hypothetical protein
VQIVIRGSEEETIGGDGGIHVAGKRSTWSAQADKVEEKLDRLNYTTIASNKFNFLYTNADCFTNKREDLSLLLGTLDYKPSLIAITEVNSKIAGNNLIESDYNLNGFNLFSVNVSVLHKRGIIVYVDNNLNSCQLEIDKKFEENIIVKISDVGEFSINVGIFYRSPNSNLENDRDLVLFIDSLTSLMNDNLLLIGDFNLPSIDWSKNRVGSNLCANSTAYKFLSCLDNNYLTQHVLFPTRARGVQASHTLDLIISNNDFVENITNLSPLGKSDHSVLHCICNLKNKKSVNVSKFNFNKGDYAGLCEYVNDVFDIHKFDNCESVNESWLYLKSTLESGQNLFIPRINNNAWRKKEAWKYPIDRSFKELISQKHRSWTRFQKN